MNRNANSIAILVLLALLFSSSVAAAKSDDRCRDVLSDGTFQTTRYRENNYFQQIIWSRFVSSTFQESKTDRDLGFGVPVGEIVIGGDYTEAQFKQKKQDILNEWSNTITASNEIDAALASGDPAIVTAWSECMKEQGGQLILRLEAASPTQIFTELAWAPGKAGTDTGVVNTKLTETIKLPTGASYVQGADCFKKGKKIGTNPCRSIVELSSALIPLVVAVNAKHGSAHAFLPPRVALKREVKPYPFTEGDYLSTYAFREEKRPSKSLSLSAAELEEGWRFSPQSAKIQLILDQKMHWVHRCDSLTSSADLYTFSYSYYIFASSKNSPERNSGITCHVAPSILMVRDRWMALDALHKSD